MIASTDDPSIDTIAASKFRRSIKLDKTHHSQLKDDNYFDWWNNSLGIATHMQHKHLILNENMFQLVQLILLFLGNANFHVCCFTRPS
jgi:hypothetical protein